VEEVQVEVLDTQVLQRVLDGQGDVLGVVVQLEELGGDPKLLTRDTSLLDTLSDLGLVSVCPGAAAWVSVVQGECEQGENELGRQQNKTHSM
jgi:hypothetical protein